MSPVWCHLQRGKYVPGSRVRPVDIVTREIPHSEDEDVFHQVTEIDPPLEITIFAGGQEAHIRHEKSFKRRPLKLKRGEDEHVSVTSRITVEGKATPERVPIQVYMRLY